MFPAILALALRLQTVRNNWLVKFLWAAYAHGSVEYTWKASTWNYLSLAVSYIQFTAKLDRIPLLYFLWGGRAYSAILKKKSSPL